jgi:TRAP-type transport system small permease protein
MELVRSFNRKLDAVLRWVLSCAFAVMILVVFLQVVNRNIIGVSLVWTLDVAQMMFSWCIFIGAALALRWNEHYILDLIPKSWGKVDSAVSIFAHVAVTTVVVIIGINGWFFAERGLNQVAAGLEIAETWFFAPIPLGAAAMVCFLAELIPDDLKRIRDLHWGSKP